MVKFFFVLMFFVSPVLTNAQSSAVSNPTTWQNIYRATATKINDLVHTKLDVKFDYDKSFLYGKAWITLHPHFYPTDSLQLDAKGMDIKEVSVIKGLLKSPLKYSYDGMMLNINLNKIYKAGENYTVFIDYVSKPNELKTKGSAAITNAKGLYFINPKGEDKNKPIQIWTQGETEANSAWFPTIDKPNQKTTEEIYMTVPSKYVTLSNGILISQKKNPDGTRTDYWKMDLPHSPYLFFMGVGDYSIIKDTYKGREVSYYVEKEYAPYARKIFGETPAMIACFEKLTGVPYVWPKYSQIVGRDYVSGAMENTTATLHGEAAYQNARQLLDENTWEDVISHELFHMWFGDLVTAESWSNITVNESLADYAETLWRECRYGKDAADDHIEENRETYLSDPANAQKNLVRFYYADKEELFDQVSYPKGGAILHMLRNYVGDSAFFKSLNKYLVDNKFKTAEATNLRLAFEEVTGKDLNWFWNQWYYGSGHPKLKIDYSYTPNTSKVIIEQRQTGEIFTLPIAIDVYTGNNKQRHNVWVKNKVDTFTFATTEKPTLINVDADKILLVEKIDNKSAENYVEQWKHATNYLDRREALQYFASKKMKELEEGLHDKYAKLREYTLTKLDDNNNLVTPQILSEIEALANNDPSKKVRANAIEILAKKNDKKYLSLFNEGVNDSSYSVAGAALEGLIILDPSNAYTLAKKYGTDAKGKLGSVILEVLLSNASENDYDFISSQFDGEPLSPEKLQLTAVYADYIGKLKDQQKTKAGVDKIIKFKNSVPEPYKVYTDPGINQALAKLSKEKRESGDTDLSNYIDKSLK